MKKISGILFLFATLAFPARSQPPLESAARFELAHDDVLIDEPIAIRASGLTPGASVTVRLRGGLDDAWTAAATFTADGDGRVDLTRMAPVKGSYGAVDTMGLFWSAERARTSATTVESDEDDDVSSAERWTLTAEVGNAIVARANIRRRAVAADVRIVPVRADGLVGVFYEPPGGGRHPAVLVLGGSGGGIPPAAGPAGGLASRGYAVLALAYFGVDGLPRALSNIPLEYFGTALRWLAAQPSVDAGRIGVLGASRGAELALLLGASYSNIRAVVAYMPSNVVWRGCCDQSTPVAWTVGGRPVAAMPPPGRRFGLDSERAEIQVERIRGAVLLISGKDDGVWESAPMAEKVVARLKRGNFPYPSQSLTYDHAGHSITRPYTSTMNLNGRRHPLSGRVMHLGGTPAGTAQAREDSWRQMLTFVDRHLRDLTVGGS
jgi:dienelactone hydrolase